MYVNLLYWWMPLQDPTPVILITRNVTLGGESGQYAAVTLRSECMMHGPLRPPGTPRLVTLFLGTQPNSLQLAVRGRLYVAHLVGDDHTIITTRYNQS